MRYDTHDMTAVVFEAICQLYTMSALAIGRDRDQHGLPLKPNEIMFNQICYLVVFEG